MTIKSNSIHTFVISLSHESLRRKTIKKKLDRVSKEFEFFDAIDARKINLLQHKDYNGLIRRLCYGKDLAPGELGCFLSHRAVLEKIVNKNESSINFWADISKTKRELGWTPKTTVNLGINKTWLDFSK